VIRSLDLKLRIIFFFSHYGAVGLLALLSYVLGRTLTYRCPYRFLSERVVFCSSVGLGTIAYLIFLLGLVHGLRREVVIPCLVIAAGFCVRSWRELWTELKGSFENRKRWALGLLAAGSVIALLWRFWVLPLYPPTGFDATMYHLPVAKFYVQQHGLAFNPYIRFSSFPQLDEMLFALALLLFDDALAPLTQFLIMFLIALAVYAWGRRLFSPRAGLWAAAIWLSNPVVLWLGTTAYVDLGVTLFVCVGAYAFFNWLETREESWLLLSAVLLGFAASSKYTGLFPVCAFGLVLLYLQIRRHSFREVAVFAAVILVVAAPWYIRNFQYTGNPVFPNLGTVFGYGHWTAAEVHSELLYQRNYGTGRTAQSLLYLPWKLTFHQPVFTHGGDELSKVYFFVFPLALMFTFNDRKIRMLVAAAIVFTLFWFYSFQIVRFLLVVIPIYTLMSAASLDRLASLIPRLQRSTWYMLGTPVVALLLLWPAGSYWHELKRNERLPVTAEQRDSYLEHNLPAYPAYEWLNRHRGHNYVLYALLDEQMTYFADGRFIGEWFGPGRYSPILEKLSAPKDLFLQLKGMGATFFLVDEQQIRDSQGWIDPKFLSFMNDPFFQAHFKIVLARPYLLLFELFDQTLGPPQPVQVLKNPGFEDLEGDMPRFWKRRGTPLIDSTGQHSFHGKVAVRVDGENWLFQRVAVQPEAAYVLRNATYASREKEFARLQINWLDCSGLKLLRADIEVVQTGPQWTDHRVTATAPENACWADVYASFQAGPEPIWFDDFALIQIQY
jgi:4-amino-4-deoxy-L-arabinose transferase-like glycosyltransferase